MVIKRLDSDILFLGAAKTTFLKAKKAMAATATPMGEANVSSHSRGSPRNDSRRLENIETGKYKIVFQEMALYWVWL